jgi:hypothetical protein
LWIVKNTAYLKASFNAFITETANNKNRSIGNIIVTVDSVISGVDRMKAERSVR